MNKIKALILIFVLAITCSFIACGSKDESQSNETGSNIESVEESVGLSEQGSVEIQDSEESKESVDESIDESMESIEDDSEEESVEDGSEEPTPEPDEPVPVKDLVDFIVDVEEGRDIRVLQLTDVQTISADQKRYPSRISDSTKTDTYVGYQRYIGQVIERYDPDFIIMTGDNTYGEFDDSGEQLVALIEFMETFEIPWAPVFGNHDNESNMGVDWQCEQFENAEYCLFKQRTLTGNGNYSVGITQGGVLKRVFYMLDSNGCGAMSKISLANGHSKTSAGFGQDQIAWYTASMHAVTKFYPEAKLSMAFHIQFAAFEDAFKLYGYNASTIRANPINLDLNAEAREAGDFGYIGREPKGPWDSGRTVWNGIKALGVDSIFVGHEHCNSASITYQGVRLTYGQKSSTYDRYNSEATAGSGIYNSNGQGTPVMGGTYITLSESDGSIADAGIYLYDHDLGWEKPTEDTPEEEETPIVTTDTEFDFNGTDFDADVTTDGVKPLKAQKVTDLSAVPAGFTGDVYGLTTGDFACVGISFSKKVNAKKLVAIKVKMYVTDYTVTSGKSPLLRIYNSTQNSILTEVAYSTKGGKTNEWVTVDILDMVKASAGMINGDGSLNAFTLLYRFYGVTQGTVYFDSLTLVSDGDPYEFETPNKEIEEVKGEICKIYDCDKLSGLGGSLAGGEKKSLAMTEDSYILSFTLTADAFAGTLVTYAYTDGSNLSSAIKITVTPSTVRINSASASYTLKKETEYTFKIGFVKLYNDNTVYTYVQINDRTVVWGVVEAYGKISGNGVIISATGSGDSFTFA